MPYVVSKKPPASDQLVYSATIERTVTGRYEATLRRRYAEHPGAAPKFHVVAQQHLPTQALAKEFLTSEKSMGRLFLNPSDGPLYRMPQERAS